MGFAHGLGHLSSVFVMDPTKQENYREVIKLHKHNNKLTWYQLIYVNNSQT